MARAEAPADDDHVLGCPAALSVPGARDDCRCSELAALFRIPTREQCFADEDPARARARWSEARAEAQARYMRLMRELQADEERAFARLRGLASDSEAVERDIRAAREVLARARH